MPWIWAVLVLQMIAGLSDSMGWLGAQTLIGHHMRGSTVYTARLSFTCRFGPLLAPPAIGYIWDVYGSSWAFVGLSVWGLGLLLICALMLPRHEQDPIAQNTPKENAGSNSRSHAQDRRLPRCFSDADDSGDCPNRYDQHVVPRRVLGSEQLLCRLSWRPRVYRHSDRFLAHRSIPRRLGWRIVRTLDGTPFQTVLVRDDHSACRHFIRCRYPRPSGLFWLLVIASAVRGAANGATQPIIISTVLRSVGGRSPGAKPPACAEPAIEFHLLPHQLLWAD